MMTNRRRAPVLLGMLFALVFLGAALGADPDRVRVAVLDLSVSAKLTGHGPEYGQEIAGQIAKRLGRFCLVRERGEILGILEENGIQMPDVFNSEEVCAKAGALLDVDFVVVGRIGPAEHGIAVNLRALDVKSGKYGEWEVEICATSNDVPKALTQLLERTGLLTSELDTDVAYYEALLPSERDWLCARKLEWVGEHPERLRAAHEWFAARGAEEWAKKCVDMALERDRESDWANAALGRRNLEEIYRHMPEDPILTEYPIKAWEDLLHLRKAAPGWGSTVEYEHAERLLTAVLDHLERMKSDPRYREAIALKARVRVLPGFSGLEFQFGYRAPYAIFCGHPDTDPGERRAAAFLHRNEELLDQFHAFFAKEIGKKLDLPPLEEDPRPDVHTLKVFQFSSRETLDPLIESWDEETPRGRAFYHPTDQWLIICEDPDDEAEADPPAEIEIAAAATQQFLQVYNRLLLEKKSGEEVSWFDGRLHRSVRWLDLGLGDLLAAGDAQKDGSREFLGTHLSHLRRLAATASEDLPDWPLETLLGVADRADELREAERLSSFEDVERMSLLFRARAWAWCHFLWFYRGGKYRKSLLSFLRADLEGEGGAEAFANAIWGKKEADWPKMEKDLQSHLKRLFSKNGLR